MRRPRRSSIGQSDRQVPLTPAQRAVVGDRPVQSRQAEQARDEARRLAKRQAGQDLDRKASSDRLVAVGLLAAPPAGRWHALRHLRIEPDRQRTTLTQRGVVGRTIKGLVASQYGLGHAAQLCRWTCNVNHGEASCNKARRKPRSITPQCERRHRREDYNCRRTLYALNTNWIQNIEVDKMRWAEVTLKHENASDRYLILLASYLSQK